MNQLTRDDRLLMCDRLELIAADLLERATDGTADGKRSREFAGIAASCLSAVAQYRNTIGTDRAKPVTPPLPKYPPTKIG